jgi:hypothetical protein
VPSDGDLLFGKLAVGKGYCAQESVDWCMAIQHSGAERTPLGRILVDEGYLTEAQHSELLSLQRKNLVAVDPVAKKTRESVLFGKLVMREGLLSADQVNECLAEQAREGERRSLGEIMVAKGLLAAEQVHRLLEKQQKRIMACPACRMSFTVLSISQDRKGVACPRCKGPLDEAGPSASPTTNAEFATQVIRAAKKELPPGSIKETRIIPPNAAKVRTVCVVCDEKIEGVLDSTGRLRCPSCQSTFVPK